jgi:hypothetical protein
LLLKSPVRAVKLMPGRDEVETLNGQRSDLPASL